MKRAGLLHLLAVSLALTGAGAAAARGTEPTKQERRARVAAEYLDATWANPGVWSGSEPWQRFVIVDTLIDYQQRTGDTRWRERIAAAVRNPAGLYGHDDALWAVLASLHAWQVERDPALLDYAAATFRRVVTDGWDNKCGGGLWWNDKRGYKNAITNEQLVYASTQLYLATGQDAYLTWARRGWDWFEASSMIGADGLVNDGLDETCRNNGQARFTYNQGVLLGGLSDLTRITGDARYRALAVRTAIAAIHGLSTKDGILREPVPQIGSDGLMFKGIFAWHLRRLVDDMPDSPDREELRRFIARNADAVWALSSEGKAPIPADWTGAGNQTGAAAQASGIAILVAATE